MADLRADVTERALDALTTAENFTRDQVAYLMHLAYESGLVEGYRGTITDLYCARDDMPALRETWELQVARRLRDLEGSAAREARYQASRPRRPSALDDVEWPAVATPGSGRPAEFVTDCPCPRTGPRNDDHPSGHVVGWAAQPGRRVVAFNPTRRAA